MTSVYNSGPIGYIMFMGVLFRIVCWGSQKPEKSKISIHIDEKNT